MARKIRTICLLGKCFICVFFIEGAIVGATANRDAVLTFARMQHTQPKAGICGRLRGQHVCWQANGVNIAKHIHAVYFNQASQGRGKMAFAADFSRTAQDYGSFRAGFPPELLVRLQPFNVGISGQRLLDIGTGTGSLARQFAKAGCIVTGIDVVDAMMAEAKRLDHDAGIEVDYKTGAAEDIPLTDKSMDVVVAGQCWHWFDPVMATREIRRVLLPGGTIVICHFDWLPLPGNVVAATEKLILQYNPAWPMAGGAGFYPRWLQGLAQGGFGNLETFSFDVNVPYSPDQWRGRIRASAGVAASLSDERVAAFDAEHGQLLATYFPDDVLSIPHRVWAVVGRGWFDTGAAGREVQKVR
ncbi:class I SAM-dependent methyltransferase [Thalassospira mesophila]|uniref:class I SAM-dependent methyltransferase n=1 Tax=Thalassospira mesophila TaxID=1293891 RepID=UPI001B8055FB|nr:class I SAM-dependent methyltransferase [Thalassospira mesophila]